MKQFGSSALGLYLPDGDIDITIVTEREELSTLKAVHAKMQKDPNYIRLDFRRGKVPIINTHTSKYDLQLDISVNKQDGLKQIFEIQKIQNSIPEFKYIFILFKCFLKIRGYSETYHGYIGSYLLFCMVF